MKRSITLITNYYPPETGAASNRMAWLAENLAKAGFKTKVLCPLPNYPTGKILDSYVGKSGQSETINGVEVTRLWVYATNSTHIWKRFFAMVSFSFSLARYSTTHQLSPYVFVQYSPLVIGFFSTLLFKNKKRKLFLNVSDLWPLAGKELGKLKDGLGYSLLEKMERYCYRKADLVLGQSQEILTHIKEIYPDKSTFLYRNLPDFNPPEITQIPSHSKKMVYAGLLGVAQGILSLCKEIELPEGWSLDIYGAGTEKNEIEKFLNTRAKPIFFKGSLSRKQLHQKLVSYDLTIVPLTNRIFGSVPSKIFEYSRLGLPILYCGGGEGEALVRDHNLGWVSPSGDFMALNTLLQEIAKQDITFWPTKTAVQDNSIVFFNAKQQFNAFMKLLD